MLPDDVASELNEIIKHDGYLFDKSDRGVYKIIGSEFSDPVQIAAHFQEIKNQIIDSIQSAQFTIWIAVAWFTDRDIGNALRLKHKHGVNVRVIVNDDDTTESMV